MTLGHHREQREERGRGGDGKGIERREGGGESELGGRREPCRLSVDQVCSTIKPDRAPRACSVCSRIARAGSGGRVEVCGGGGSVGDFASRNKSSLIFRRDQRSYRGRSSARSQAYFCCSSLSAGLHAIQSRSRVLFVCSSSLPSPSTATLAPPLLPLPRRPP